ncbi:DUF2232 domain-containing protein [Gracilibacillus sp. YIM 98692]|uniref:YybS family protein n=1 Tax=Gracilibacillus sp. YIM 98692 TaxID=2663532 RepID=UPI0013D15721|nr:DUF2232 domain-containing protein [Gracilibacillus sp. YIM 98692]
MTNQKIGKDFWLYIGGYILLLLLAIFVPLLQLIVLFLLPLPVIFLVVQYDKKLASIGLGFLVLLSLFLYPIIAFPLTFLAMISGIMIGFSLKKKQHAYETWAKGSAGYLIGFAFIYVFVETVLNFSIQDSFIQTMDESLAMTEELFLSVGIDYFSDDDLKILREQMMQMLQLLPVILVVISMVLSFFTQWLSYKWWNKFMDQSLYFPPFRQFQLPKIMLWIYLIILLLSFIGIGEKGDYISIAIFNISHLLGVLLMLQGLSFIFYYSYVKKGSKALPIISILIIVFFPIIGLYLARILGIIDLGFELKKRITK